MLARPHDHHDAVSPAVLRALRERIETLEEENRQLREALRPAIMFPPTWKLTGREMELLAVVYGSKSHVRWGLVRTALLGASDDFSPKLLEVYLHKTRRKLHPHGITIQTMHGIGLCLPPESRAIIDASLAGLVAGRAG